MAEPPSSSDGPGYVYAFVVLGMLTHIILPGTYVFFFFFFQIRASEIKQNCI